MPNHVMNRIIFECSDERLKDILSAICYDNDSTAERTGIGTIDFNKITPMPSSLDIESGSNTERGIELYLTSVNPAVKYYGKEKMTPTDFNALTDEINKRRIIGEYNASLTLDQIEKATLYRSADELIELGKTAVGNFIEYGAITWYDWCTREDTWNTKWNSYNSAIYNGGNEICFQTAWAAPHPIIEKLSALYPDVVVRHNWANEDFYQNCGSNTYLNGEIIDFEYPETDKEHLELAASIWEYDLEWCGYVISESGDDYVNVHYGEFELISVNGIPALFTNERLNLNEIPKGLNLYHLRMADDGETYASIENQVVFNHGGCIITDEPLDFGENEYLSLNESNAINFIGEEISFYQFMKGDFENEEDVDIEPN